MRKHPLNCIMGFTCIRGAKHSHNTIIWGHRPIP
jgi:hypothetical protein